MDMSDMPDEVRQKVEEDELIYGEGFAEKDNKGNWKFVPYDEAQELMDEADQIKSRQRYDDRTKKWLRSKIKELTH